MAPFSRFFKRSVSKQQSPNEQTKPTGPPRASGRKPQKSQGALQGEQRHVPAKPLPTPPESNKSTSTESIATRKPAPSYRRRYYSSPISPSVPLTPVEAYGLEQPQEYDPPRRRMLAKATKLRPQSMAVSASQQASARRPLSLGPFPYSPTSTVSQAASASSVSGRPSPSGKQLSHGRYASYSSDVPSSLTAGRVPDSPDQTATQSQPRSVSGPSVLSEWTVSSSRPESGLPTPRSSAQFERRHQQSPTTSSPAISQANSTRTSIDGPLRQRTPSASRVSQKPTEGSANLSPQQGSHQRSLSLDTTITIEPRRSYEPSSVSRDASNEVSPVVSDIDSQNTLRDTIGSSDTVAASHTARSGSETREEPPSWHDSMHSERSKDGTTDNVSDSSPANNIQSEPTHPANEAPTQQPSASTDEAKREDDEPTNSTPQEDVHRRQLSVDTIVPEHSNESSSANAGASDDVSPVESYRDPLRESGDKENSVTASSEVSTSSSNSEARAELPLPRHDPMHATQVNSISDSLSESARENAEPTSTNSSNDEPTQHPGPSAVDLEGKDGSEPKETTPQQEELDKRHPSLDTIPPPRIDEPHSVDAVSGGDVSPVKSCQDPLRDSGDIGSSVTATRTPTTSSNSETPAELSPSRHDPTHATPSESAPADAGTESTGLSNGAVSQPEASAHHLECKGADEPEKNVSPDTIEPPRSDGLLSVDAEASGNISPEHGELRNCADSDTDTVTASRTITDHRIISQREEKQPPSRGDSMSATYSDNGDSAMSSYAPSPVRNAYQIAV